MVMTREALPFGLRDVKIGLLDATTQLPTVLVDLPNSQTFSFTDSEDFEELRGDDRVVAKRGKGAVVEWELESGGIMLEAYAIMAGGTVVISGVSPNQKKIYKKKATTSRPDFWVEGQAYSESGGDYHAVLPRCKADDSLEGNLEDGSFMISSASGTGMSSLAPVTDTEHFELLYKLVHNETATPTAVPVAVP
jgi:hypothetical protein